MLVILMNKTRLLSYHWQFIRRCYVLDSIASSKAVIVLIAILQPSIVKMWFHGKTNNAG